MSTLKELIYNVRNTNSKGRSNRVLTASDRQIQFWIKQARNFLLYADIKKNNGQVPIGYEQDLGCVTLSTVDQADCSKYNWGTDVKKVTIPPILDLPDNGGLTFFGLIDKRTDIWVSSENYGDLNDAMPWKRKRYREGQKIGNTIYLYGDGVQRLCTVNIRGVFADPTQVEFCATEGSVPCCFDPDTTTYPIPAHLEPILFQYIDEKFIFPKIQLPPDLVNNEKDESVV